jgi:hypothetical protein
MTVLMALSMIASEQTKGTKNTMEKAYQVLGYLAMHPDAKIQFCASDMVMNIHDIQMPCTSQSPMAAAEQADIFSWDPYLKAANPSN